MNDNSPDDRPHIIRGPRRGLDRTAPGMYAAVCSCGIAVYAGHLDLAETAIAPCRDAEARRLDRFRRQDGR